MSANRLHDIIDQLSDIPEESEQNDDEPGEDNNLVDHTGYPLSLFGPRPSPEDSNPRPVTVVQSISDPANPGPRTYSVRQIAPEIALLGALSSSLTQFFPNDDLEEDDLRAHRDPGSLTPLSPPLINDDRDILEGVDDLLAELDAHLPRRRVPIHLPILPSRRPPPPPPLMPRASATSDHTSIDTETDHRLTMPTAHFESHAAGCVRCEPRTTTMFRKKLARDYERLHPKYADLVAFLMIEWRYRFEDAVMVAKRREDQVNRMVREERAQLRRER